MECNKEEAIRAKGIAENKMHNRDFIGARKIVLKAHQLFPDLENVSQMLTVCEVHNAAGTKVNGETDWYGILQVEPAADDSVIKKQYRKLALLLHPDKNKFGGAEAAFKFVVEAHSTLSDRDKRALHDMKRGVGFRTASTRPVQQSNRPSFTKKQSGVSKNTTSTQFNDIKQPQAPSFSSSQTFWTICPFCGIRYQYYQNIMNRALRCQNCMKPFVAYDLNAQPVPSAAAWNRTGNPQPEKPCPSAHYGGPKSNFGTAAGMASQANVGKGSTASEPSTGAGMNTEFVAGSSKKTQGNGKVESDSGTGNGKKFEKVKLPEVKKRDRAGGSQKRGRKMVVETSESESSDSAVVIEDGNPVGQDASAGITPRRSTRQKQNVSYKENRDGADDFMTPISKKLRKEIPMNTQRGNKDFDEEKTNGFKVQSDAAISADRNDKLKRGGFGTLPNGSHEVQHDAGKRERGLHTDASSEADDTVDCSSNSSPPPETFSYPDPEFCDFGKERDKSKFAADQIWAAYDELDAMPRYYAWIRHVYSPKFKMRFTWLEYDPVTKDESTWFEGDLPVGCGSYKLGKSDDTEDFLMFSHLMPFKKGTKRNSFEIYPRKSEVWALFKDWNIEWASCMDDKRQYEYDVVEVLSDFTEGAEITAVRLVKVQGFVGLFVKSTDKVTAPLKIRKCDLLQFSHKIPSYRLTGNERSGIPKGTVELDCASLPPNFAANYPSISPESIKLTVVDLDSVSSGSHSGAKEEFPRHATSSSSFKLNQKTAQEEVQSSSSHNKENDDCMKKPNISNTAQCAASDSGKHAESDELASKRQVDTRKRNIHAQDPDARDDENQTNPNAYEYPDSEFHDFEEGRSVGKFEQGQIWALYSDIDSYPKYYALIKKVELENFKVIVRWLEGFSDREEDGQWYGKQLPVGCGTFKITQESAEFDSADTFSHLVQARPMVGRKHFVITPTIGEIWALYKNWSVGWSYSDLETCELDVVEILASDSSGFRVSPLAKVNGYRFVFKPQRGSGTELFIPHAERLRFSHQIPAFRLTEERGGKLRGYWELDPASVPDLFLVSS
ncbi:uncharacterized protein M6B38_319660 [Iris pallida]|uniref:J domain-containing protein n=1 Tax=Iris pallida TaxID=29817 RepID=A0AAX6HC05_IRIPA|nr:uncharacterized protein M6B38_319660 [Iris pallida]